MFDTIIRLAAQIWASARRTFIPVYILLLLPVPLLLYLPCSPVSYLLLPLILPSLFPLINFLTSSSLVSFLSILLFISISFFYISSCSWRGIRT